MLINLLFLFAVSSGSALAAVLWKREYEDVLPVTASIMILIPFFMGVAGFLEAGFWITVSMAIVAWGIAFIVVARKKDIKNTVKPFFSHGFWLFLILYAGFNYVLNGMNVHEWDEFSHWATVVKAMIQTSHLGTAPQAHLFFGTYPPGMALFQYFLQKIFFIARGGDFSEWRLYLAYTVLEISFILPLLKRVGAKSFKGKLFALLMVLLIPVAFYPNCYHTLLIDSFLGVLSGAGMAMIVAASDKRNNYCFLYLLSICAILPLMKVSGMLLAVCIAYAYIVDYGLQTAASWKDILKRLGLFGLAMGGPELLWIIHVRISGVQMATSVAFRFTDLYKILSGQDESYRTTVFNLFKMALFNNSITENDTNFAVSSLGLSISYFSLLIIFVIAMYLSWYAFKKNDQTRASSVLIAVSASVVCWLCFYMSLGIMYLFKFSEEAALQLASYSRYIRTIYLSMYFLVMIAVLSLIFKVHLGKTVFVLSLGILFLLTPMEDVAKLVFRDIVQESIHVREPFVAFSKKIRDLTEPYDNVFLVCQEDRDLFSTTVYWTTSFEVRPTVIDQSVDGCMLSRENTDRWYISGISAAEWRQLLIDKYDYVAIYMLDDYFYATFSELFAEPEDIGEKRIYKVNKDSGLLELRG